MITAVYFDAQIVVPQGKSNGEGLPRVDLRETSFHASDGWDIRETLPGVFSLHIEGMTSPCTVGGYGYSYVQKHEEPPPPVEESKVEEPKKRGKRGP